MEYGDFIVYLTFGVLGASALVIVILLLYLYKKSGEPPAN